MKPNNEQIDNTSYYALPCGRQLEEFVWWRRLDFATGSALKYRFRAGRKDGESMAKDLAKRDHYTAFLASHTSCGQDWHNQRVEDLYHEAMAWDGKDF